MHLAIIGGADSNSPPAANVKFSITIIHTKTEADKFGILIFIRDPGARRFSAFQAYPTPYIEALSTSNHGRGAYPRSRSLSRAEIRAHSLAPVTPELKSLGPPQAGRPRDFFGGNSRQSLQPCNLLITTQACARVI